MRPELFTIPLPGGGSLPIRSFGFFLLVGFVCALAVARRRSEARGRDGAFLVDLATITLLAGIAGARAFYLWQYRDTFNWGVFHLFDGRWEWGGVPLGALGALLIMAFFRNVPLRDFRALFRPPALAGGFAIAGALLGARILFALWHPREAGPDPLALFRIDQGGLVFYGGLITGIPVGIAWVRWKRLPLGEVADLFAPALALGLAFGRIGCFLNGCCGGKLTDLPWAIAYPPGSPVFAEVARLGLLPPDAPCARVHPTQLLSSGLDYVLFLGLLWIPLTGARNGARFALFLIGYGMLRFGVELLRENPPYPAGLSIPQWISVALFVIGGLLFLRLRRAAHAN
jgi:phosphatidylglycerol:prolipoprotein diacylglycerol transferase